jgi:hypothetical protein
LNLHHRSSKLGSLPLADSRECPAGIEPASPGWKPGTFAARPRAQSCGGRNRTCVGAINSRLPVPARVPPQSVRTAGFEPAISCARGTRNPRLSHVLKQERPAGIEPALPPWQGSRLPLHHGRFVSQPNCQITRAHASGVPRARRRTRTGVTADHGFAADARGQCPLTDRRTSRVGCAPLGRTAGREAFADQRCESVPASAAFQTAADHASARCPRLSYRPELPFRHKKSPVSL